MRDDRTRPPAGPHGANEPHEFPDFEGMPLVVLRRYLKNRSDAAEVRRVERWASESAVRQRYLDALRALLERAPHRAKARAELAWNRLAGRLEGSPVPSTARPASVRRRPELVRHSAAPRQSDQLKADAFLPRRGSRSAALLAAAAVIAALAGSALLGRAGNRRAAVPDASPMRLIATAAGQRAEVRLSDGTRVELGVASRLRLAPDFGGDSRDLYLDGAAYFDVAHDSTRPFRVHTSTAVTQDVGTRFVVTAYPGNQSTQVVVAEGEVMLRSSHDSASPPVSLDAGHLARIAGEGGHVVVRAADPAEYTAWIDGRLVFRDAPLSEVAAELERWYDVDVQIADTALARIPLSASFDVETFNEALNVITTVLPLRAERSNGVVTLHRR